MQLCSNAPQTVFYNCFLSSHSGHTSELKATVDTEVRDQMMLVSGQLDKRLKESADQQISTKH